MKISRTMLIQLENFSTIITDSTVTIIVRADGYEGIKREKH